VFEKVTKDEHSSLFCRSLGNEKRNILGHCTKTIFCAKPPKVQRAEQLKQKLIFLTAKTKNVGREKKGATTFSRMTCTTTKQQN
jgi:hypothetical protein